MKMVPSSLGIEWPELDPGTEGLRRAAQVLNEGETVAILIGQGARNAAAEVQEVADLLGAGVAKALLGKDSLPDTLPFVTGSIGLLGTRPSYEMMRDCDTLLTIGSSFPYLQYMPEPEKTRGVQIDVDPTMIGMRYPYEVNLVADAASGLRALIPLLTRKEGRGWRDDIEDKVAKWWADMRDEALVDADPVNPLRVFSEFSERMPASAIVTSDSGSAANWYARQLRFPAGVRGSLSGNLATMGPAVPYAIGAKMAHPDRPVIAFEGDGAMQMNGLAELITIARYWQDWSDPRLVVVVLHNNDLNQVTWELRAFSGSPTVPMTQELPDVDYAGFAASLGLGAISVDTPDALGSAWDQALTATRPTVLDVRTDPNIPPIPPHATLKQALNTAKSAARGDENAWQFIKEGLKTKAQEILPGHRE
jgi:pyruvate dehydrogenase (quinone)